MSVRRLSNIDKIPITIRKAFRNAPEPREWEETVWREVAARMVLDALGYTGLGSEPEENDAAIRDAKRWFRGIPNPEDPIMVFDYANMEHYLANIREIVLNYPVTYLLDFDDDESEYDEPMDLDNEMCGLEELGE